MLFLCCGALFALDMPWVVIWCLRTFGLFLRIKIARSSAGFFSANLFSNDNHWSLHYRSVEWKCEHCGLVRTSLRPVTEASQALNKEAKELGSQIKLQVSVQKLVAK
jgi:hypothetical protein